MKLSKEERARREGMAYALKVAKEKGVDGLEEEMKRRGVSIAPCILPEKELDELYQFYFAIHVAIQAKVVQPLFQRSCHYSLPASHSL